MAFVDMAFLRRDDLKNGALVYCRRKTGQRLIIRIEDCIREILDRHTSRGSEYLLPILPSANAANPYRSYRLALSRYNHRLRVLSQLLRLTHPLTSYVSRHSWATVARNRRIPVSVISEGMGHASEKTTRIYLATLDQSLLDRANRKVIRGL